MAPPLQAEDIAKRLPKASRAGTGWQACCPAHNDKKPSLLLYDRTDGSIFARCQAGCSFPEVRAALKSLGLWPAGPNGRAQGPAAAKTRGRGEGEGSIVMPVPEDAPRPNYERLLGWPPTEMHVYLDAEAQPLFLVARRDHQGSKDIRPLTLWRLADGTTAWKLRAPPEPRPLYGLDRLAARPDAPVLLVEGEKTAIAAARRFPSFVAVTWSGGAAAVDKTDWGPLRGREVTLWPDNDEAGRKAMARVQELLAGEGT